MIKWHRLFGLALIDFFDHSPYEVELEIDLSRKQQFLDVVILRKNEGTFSGRLPDGLDVVRLIALSQISRAEHNAIWHLFSAIPETVSYAFDHFQIRTPDSSTIINQLYEKYQREGLNMPYTMDDFRHDFTQDHLHLLTVEERLRGVSADEQLQSISLEKIADYLKKHPSDNADEND